MESIKIVFSGEDEAGMLVARQLREKFGFSGEGIISEGERRFKAWKNESLPIELIEVKERLSRDCEYIAGLPEVFACKLIIFASRHVSASGTPCFTAHATGNFTEKNEFGGNALELGRTSARASACLIRWLKRQESNFAGYGVFREATHHGPTSLPWPSFFAELGSTQANWRDEKAAAHLAEAIIFTAKNWEKEEGTPSVGFGGTHYCSKFSQMEWEGKKCFSHVASKHSLDGMELRSVQQALEKTAESAGGKEVEFLLDWKGTTLPQREKLIKLFQETGGKWKRI